MAAEHEALYDELLAVRDARAARAAERAARKTAEAVAWRAPEVVSTERIALDRPGIGQPLVSIIVPCYNHGLFLPACLLSIREQDYPEIEVVLVDDASTDDGTRAAIAAVEEEGSARVIRQPENRGPSAARNAALEIVRGRYVLPVDADNLLLPEAVSRLVLQLQSAGETTGFIYPNPPYFGNRNDYFEAPDYNLHALLRGKYSDTCSLFDRAVFDAGDRFAEDIELGHEDVGPHAPARVARRARPARARQDAAVPQARFHALGLRRVRADPLQRRYTGAPSIAVRGPLDQAARLPRAVRWSSSTRSQTAGRWPRSPGE